MKEIQPMTFQEFKRFVSSQADNTKQNSVSLDDFSRDGMQEYFYPKRFVVNGDNYDWTYGTAHTRGRHLCNHYEIWGHGKAVGHVRVATGVLTKGKIFKFLHMIHQFYNGKISPL